MSQKVVYAVIQMVNAVIQNNNKKNYNDDAFLYLQDYCYLKHIYTNDLNETYDMVYEWRELLEKYRTEKGGCERILMTEGSAQLDKIIPCYGNGHRNGSQIPFNFYFMVNTNKMSKAADYKFLIESYLKRIPVGYEANWVVRTQTFNSEIDAYLF